MPVIRMRTVLGGRREFSGHCFAAPPVIEGFCDEQLLQRGRLDHHPRLPDGHYRARVVVWQRPAQHARLLSWQQECPLVGHRPVHRRRRNQRADDYRGAGDGLRRQHRLPPDDHRLRHRPHHPGHRSRPPLLQGRDLLPLPVVCQHLRPGSPPDRRRLLPH